MNTEKQKKRASLHVFIDTEVLRRLYAEPIEAMKLPSGTIPPKATRRKYVTEVVQRLQRSFIDVLTR